MKIPNDFKGKVLRIFGEEGDLWLENLDQTIHLCKEKWNLTNCTLSKDLSMNLICFADSKYGHVALKVGVPHRDLFTEMEALSIYKGRNICNLYDYDVDLGALLLERIRPGVQLLSLENTSERIAIASELITKLPISIDRDGKHSLPYYRDWIQRAFARSRRENKVGNKMLSYINVAEDLFNRIENQSSKRALLHGDLHHENILRTSNGWKAIDPKGVIGLPYMESARFMENQIDMVDSSERLNCLNEMTELFSNKFNEPMANIAASVFILRVLSICWTFEEHKQPDNISDIIDGCELLLSYFKSLQ
ncbi:hypothetical protein HYG86_12435 [Alkalicella caledoniensis]|uniref:Streptomycin 6-kinase n=1 Tax=Alkalicella caledoniensis TaxID=2731377 RepID=A0A7G9WA06_ALKCA|nr:aminoglycoside phosphotransferase family protein [Alkalicella caledoniensis]QNO15518.1 hypothetical protein HYG86_12435 [Alkalicella caledoniensis]